MRTTFSVIIPSYNSFLTIPVTLNSLRNQSCMDLITEIIVVDSSDDNQTKLLLRDFNLPFLKVIDAGIKVIPAIGRNIGAKVATGNVLAFIDSDAYPDKNWIENITKAYDKGCVVGGGSVALPDNQRKKPIALAQYYLQFNEYLPTGDNRVKSFIPSVNFFCDRELFFKVGGFPEIRAAEDVLFGLSVSKIAKVWFYPNIKVFHIFREDMGGFLRNQELLGKYIIIYRRQHYKSFIYKGIMPILLLPLFMLVKFYGIAKRILQVGSVHAVGFFISLPLFFYGLFWWGIGFLRGCFGREKNEV